MGRLYIYLSIASFISVVCLRKVDIPAQFEEDNRNFKQSIILLNESRDLSNPPESVRQETFILPQEVETKIMLNIEEGIQLSKQLSDAYLDFLHPELKVMFKDKLITGTQYYYEGLKAYESGDSAEGLKKQLLGNALVIDWIEWWDMHGRSITDKVYGQSIEIDLSTSAKILIVVIIMFFLSVIAAYTSNFQISTLIIGKKLSSDNPLLPRGAQDAITPKAQTIRNIIAPLLFLLLIVISFIFFNWLLTLGIVMIEVLGIIIMKFLMPKIESQHYVDVVRRYLIMRLKHYQKVNDYERADAVSYFLGKLEESYGYKKGWHLLPQGFVERLKNKIGATKFNQLTEVGNRHNMFEQHIFKNSKQFASSEPLVSGPPGCTMDMFTFSYFLSSMANSLAKSDNKEDICDAFAILDIASLIMPENPMPHVTYALICAFDPDFKIVAKRHAEIALSLMNQWPSRYFDKFEELRNQMLDVLIDKYVIRKEDQQYFERGINYMDKSEYSLAVDAFNEFVIRQPQNPTGWYNLATAYLNLGDLQNAEKALLKAISLQPNFSHALGTLGYVYNQRRDWEKAIGILEKAIDSDPYDEEAWFNLGIATISSNYTGKWDIRTIIEKLDVLEPALANRLREISRDNGIKFNNKNY